jgi:hypothetical protein
VCVSSRTVCIFISLYPPHRPIRVDSFTTLYFNLIYSTLLYFTLLYSTLLCCTLINLYPLHRPTRFHSACTFLDLLCIQAACVQSGTLLCVCERERERERERVSVCVREVNYVLQYHWHTKAREIGTLYSELNADVTRHLNSTAHHEISR